MADVTIQDNGQDVVDVSTTIDGGDDVTLKNESGKQVNASYVYFDTAGQMRAKAHNAQTFVTYGAIVDDGWHDFGPTIGVIDASATSSGLGIKVRTKEQ